MGKYKNHLTHDQVIPLLREIPGREMLKNICLVLEPWTDSGPGKRPEFVFYSSHGEFTLGPCAPGGEVGRMDSIVEIYPPDLLRKPYCTIGLEIKDEAEDLRKDQKLSGKYLASRMCDYYFMVAISDELALEACVKYLGCPAIGVASLASGRVLKVPVRQDVPEDRRQKYRNQLQRRPQLKNSSPYHKYYLQDDDLIILLLGKGPQIAPIVRVVCE